MGASMDTEQPNTHKIFTRDFVNAFLAQFTFASAFYTLIPTLPVFLSSLGRTESEIGVLIGASSISSLLLRPLVGRALLRYPERTLALAGTLLFTVSTTAYLAARPFWPLLFVRILQGASLAIFFTAVTMLVANTTPEGYRGRSLSYFFLAFNVAFAIAPSSGMILMNAFGFTFLFLVCTLLAIASHLFASRLEKRGAPSPDAATEDGFFFSRKALPPSILAFFIHVIYGSVTTFFPIYAVTQGVANPGWFFAAFAMMLILGRTLGAKTLDLYSREKIILPCLSAFVIAMVILAFSKTLPMFLLAAVIWGSGNAFLYPALVTFTLDLAGPSRAPALAFFSALCDLGVGLGAVIMGVVLRFTSYRTMFLCLALNALMAFCYYYFLVLKREKTETQGRELGSDIEGKGNGTESGAKDGG